MSVWYNDNNAYACRVLRARVLDGSLPMGDVDERDITEIEPEEVAHYFQWHLFAGIGGFPLGLKWAGFPAGVRILTGGFPCQDISNAGLRAGIGGTRSGLWGEMARFIRVLRPEIVIVENVAALLAPKQCGSRRSDGMGRVLGDLAACGYDAEWDCIPAAAVGAPHLRDRVFIVAYPNGGGKSATISQPIFAGLEGPERGILAIADFRRYNAHPAGSGWWAVEPNVGRVADGVPNRVGKLAGLGNAIVPQIAQFLATRIMQAFQIQPER